MRAGFNISRVLANFWQFLAVRRRARREQRRWKLFQEARRKTQRSIRTPYENLEPRVVLAEAWTGAVSSNWNDTQDGTTNWVGNTLPSDGDTLTFGGDAIAAMVNDTPDGNSYNLVFSQGGYSVSGSAIALDNPGVDLVHTTGAGELALPLMLAADSLAEVQAGELTLSGTLSGDGGLEKTGAGTLVLEANNDFAGNTVVSAGTVALQGSLLGPGAVEVSSQGTFVADGVVSGAVKNRGVVSPGVDSIATVGLLTTDSFTQYTGGVLQIDIASATNYDMIDIRHVATLAGTLQITIQDGFVPQAGDTFDILTYESVVGSFDLATGLLGTDRHDIFFEIVQLDNRLQLVAHDFPIVDTIGLVPMSPSGYDALGQLFNYEYFGFDTFSIEASIHVSGFFAASGSFTIQRGSQSVTLADDTTVNTTVYKFGGTNITAFAGMNGPYRQDTDGDGDIDGDDELNPDSVGFSLSDAEFGLALFFEQGVDPFDGQHWVALSAQAGAAEFVGLADFHASGTDLKVEINTALGFASGVNTNDKVIDFSTDSLTIATSPTTSISIDSAGEAGVLVRASGNLDIAVGQFVQFSGGIAFSAQNRDDVLLADGTRVDLEELVFGATGLTGFVGNRAGTDDAVGFAVEEGSIALVVSNDSNDLTRQWTSIQGFLG